MLLSLQILLITTSLVANVAGQIDKATGGGDWNYLCESLICDPPKVCVLRDQVAQCLADVNDGSSDGDGPNTTPNLFGGPVFTQAPRLPPQPEGPNGQFFRQPEPTFAPPTYSTRISIPIGPEATTTTPSPFAPLLSLFGSPPPLTLPTLPTLPPPPTTTTPAPVNVCTLPPVTGNCSKARIMWYFDTETGKCERFSYSGCGNANRFASRLHCEESCGGRRWRKL